MYVNGYPVENAAFIPPAETLPRIIMLSPDKDVAWKVMPEVLRRMARFCAAQDTESDPEILCDVVKKDFVEADDKRNFAIMVALDPDDQVIGHLLALRETYCKKQYINVLQFALDKGIPAGLLQAAFTKLEDWGNLHMAVEVRAWVKTEAQARRLQIFYGFERYRIQLRKEL